MDQVSVSVAMHIFEILNLPSIHQMYRKRRDMPTNANSTHFLRPKTAKTHLYNAAYKFFKSIWLYLKPWYVNCVYLFLYFCAVLKNVGLIYELLHVFLIACCYVCMHGCVSIKVNNLVCVCVCFRES